jgi:hypothetical protein
MRQARRSGPERAFGAGFTLVVMVCFLQMVRSWPGHAPVDCTSGPGASARVPAPGSSSWPSARAQNRASPRDLPTQHRDLMPQDEDLRILRDVTACQERQPAEHPDHGQVDEANEHKRRAPGQAWAGFWHGTGSWGHYRRHAAGMIISPQTASQWVTRASPAPDCVAQRDRPVKALALRASGGGR